MSKLQNITQALIYNQISAIKLHKQKIKVGTRKLIKKMVKKSPRTNDKRNEKQENYNSSTKEPGTNER